MFLSPHHSQKAVSLCSSCVASILLSHSALVTLQKTLPLRCNNCVIAISSLSSSRSLSVCLSLSLARSLSPSLSLARALSHTHSPSLSRARSRFLSHPPSLPLSHTLAQHESLYTNIEPLPSLVECELADELVVCFPLSLSRSLSLAPSLSLSVSRPLSLSLALSRSTRVPLPAGGVRAGRRLGRLMHPGR